MRRVVPDMGFRMGAGEAEWTSTGVKEIRAFKEESVKEALEHIALLVP